MIIWLQMKLSKEKDKDNPNDNIKNYLQVPEDSNLIEDENLINENTVAINRDINVTDKRTDVSIFFNTDRVKPVEYDYLNNVYLPYKFEATSDYRDFVPDLTETTY